METRCHSVGQRVETVTLLFQKKPLLSFHRSKGGVSGWRRTRWRGKTLGRNSGNCEDSAEEPAGPPRSDGGNAAINKSAGACGGLWLLTCATTQLFSRCSDTRETLRSSDRRSLTQVRKPNHLFCLELHVRLPLNALPPSTVGGGGSAADL